ncbi:MAG TPA: BMP family ABC transporter substrate-binding protein [Treponema sp.]|nr:BMP family ABC transporter substrate-binding protein [Treponema sp.]
MKKLLSIFIFSLFLFVSIQNLVAGGSHDNESKTMHIAVFVPGIVSGSPVYEMLCAGVRSAVAESTANGNTVDVTVIEAGTRQADWGTKMTSLVAQGTYDLIVTSNPAMPEIIDPISRQFPIQKFLIFDAWFSGNPAITTFRYNQREQGYLSGYIAALVSTSSMEYANSQKKIGLIAAQEYPAMNEIILPAFREGAQAAVPGCTVDFRVVGNWYDATKAAELSRAMKNAGCDVIMPIAGGANQGVIAAAKDTGFYIAWFDDNGFIKAPGLIISSAVMAQERLAYEKTLAFITGSLETGNPTTLGLSDGYISLVTDDLQYIETVPQDIREKMNQILTSLKNGTISLPAR